jgi:hypothetical protein
MEMGEYSQSCDYESSMQFAGNTAAAIYTPMTAPNGNGDGDADEVYVDHTLALHEDAGKDTIGRYSQYEALSILRNKRLLFVGDRTMDELTWI